MSNIRNILSFSMLLVSLGGVVHAEPHQHPKILNVNDIVDEDHQQVIFIDKKGECNYYGQASLVLNENSKILGFEMPELPKNKAWELKITKKVCHSRTENKDWYVIPDEKTFHRTGYGVLIPAGTEFYLFTNKDEMKEYFPK